MTGEGVIRVDPNGLLVNVTRASYAGGTLEALVRLERIKNPPLPVRIALRGRGLDFEQFFADLGLRGTGLMGRADLDTTLTFGRGGIEHADGIGRIHVTADAGRPSAVHGTVRAAFFRRRSPRGPRRAAPLRGRLVRDGREAPGSASTAGCASEPGSPTFSSTSPPTTSPRSNGSRTTSIPPSRTSP